MKIFVYDYETFQYDWVLVTQDYATEEFRTFHNDNEAVLNFMQEEQESLFIGYNTKGFDQFVMKAVCCGCDTYDIKALSDYIVAGGNGWECPITRDFRFSFHNADIMDDMQVGLSLKAIEGHLGMSIEESTVDFNIDRPLTSQELDEVVHYCMHDVSATTQLVKLRKNYLQTKLQIGRMVGLEDAKSLSMTNAKLTAAFLKARRPLVPWTDERQYKYPENLKTDYIPQKVFEFFNRMHDPSVSDDELFKSKLKIPLGEAEATIGFGGIHLGIPNYMWGGDVKYENTP